MVAHQCRALAQWDPQIHDVYRSLGRVAVELAAARGAAAADALAAIRELLQA